MLIVSLFIGIFLNKDSFSSIVDGDPAILYEKNVSLFFTKLTTINKIKRNIIIYFTFILVFYKKIL